MGNSIVLAGGTGFVGVNLRKYLEDRYFTIQEVQLRGHNFLPQFHADAIVSLIGKAHDLRKITNSEEYYAVNTELTKKIFDAFLSSDAKKFVWLSSVKAAADTVNNILTESVIPKPLTHYGKSKLLAEEYILSRALAVEKQVYILRPCMIHGPRNRGNLNLLYKVAKLGIPYPLGSFENQRSFLSVENLCFVIKELIERTDIASGIYNVADDTPLSTNRVIEIMYETKFKKARLWNINKCFIRSLAKIGDFLPFPLNSDRLQKLTESYVVSNIKLLNALKKPLPLSAEDGLRKTIQSFADFT